MVVIVDHHSFINLCHTNIKKILQLFSLFLSINSSLFKRKKKYSKNVCYSIKYSVRKSHKYVYKKINGFLFIFNFNKFWFQFKFQSTNCKQLLKSSSSSSSSYIQFDFQYRESCGFVSIPNCVVEEQ